MKASTKYFIVAVVIYTVLIAFFIAKAVGWL